MYVSNAATRKCATADERQVHTPDRHDYVSAGSYNTRYVKQATNRRERRQGKAELRNPRAW